MCFDVPCRRTCLMHLTHPVLVSSRFWRRCLATTGKRKNEKETTTLPEIIMDVDGIGPWEDRVSLQTGSGRTFHGLFSSERYLEQLLVLWGVLLGQLSLEPTWKRSAPCYLVFGTSWLRRPNVVFCYKDATFGAPGLTTRSNVRYARSISGIASRVRRRCLRF